MGNIIRSVLILFCVGILGACSGVETIPGDTTRFISTGYTSYGWQNAPLTQSGYSKDKLYQADPAIRKAVEERMAELGYRLVAKSEAEFLVDYVAISGVNEGLLESTAANITPYPSGMIGRQVDGASVDNAYALAADKQTGKLMLAFLDSKTSDLLWQVRVSSLIRDANDVDLDSVRQAIRQGLSTLPAAR